MVKIFRLKMSWQSYVDDQLMATKFVNQAVIAGHDGNIWAQSEGFTVSMRIGRFRLPAPDNKIFVTQI